MTGPFDVDSDGFDSQVDDLFDDPYVDEDDFDSEEDEDVDSDDYSGYSDELE